MPRVEVVDSAVEWRAGDGGARAASPQGVSQAGARTMPFIGAETLAVAFALVYVAGFALIFSPNLSTRVAGFFLCLAGTVGVGVGLDTWLPSLGMLLVLIAIVLTWLRWWLRKPEEDYRPVPCPECGRVIATTTQICPRCGRRRPE